MLCHALVGALQLVVGLFRGVVGGARLRPQRRPARIVLTGTFFADNWVEAHVRPLAECSRCAHVYVVSDHPFVPMEKVTYVCAPLWLQRLVGRVPARSILFAITALVRRADIVGGFHLLCNGLLAQAVGAAIGARVMYFCVGGWAEIVHGGVHGGNHMFTLIGRNDRLLERLLIDAVGKFDLILTMGTGAKAFLEEGAARCPVEVMPGGIDGRFTPARHEDRSFDLITVSRIVSVKRLDVLLDAVARVVTAVPAVTAVLVGDGDQLPDLKRQCHRLGLDDRVAFVGRQQSVPRWLADARLFVLTSDSEGLSLALMEAMMAGLPAIVSDVGDLGDLVTDGVNGFLIPPRDAQAFARRITELLTDPGKYEQFSRAARQSALANSVPAMASRWDELLSRWSYAPARPAGPPRPAIPWLPKISRKNLWETTRFLTRRPIGRALGAIRPQLWLGKEFRAHLRKLEAAQRWTADRALAHQLAEMKRVVALAYDRSPYYRRILREQGFEPGDLKSLNDVARLPLLDHADVRRHLHAMRLSGVGPAELVSTGGTGGAPLYFFIGVNRSALEYAHLVVSWRRAGFDLGMELAAFRGRPVAVNGRGFRHEFDPLLRCHYYSTFHMGAEDMRRYLDHIRTLGPCFLHVYPSAVATLAAFLRQDGAEPPRNVRGIIAESEIVYPQQRAIVENVFGCRYFSCYGHTEKVVAAAECEHTHDYHVWPTYGYCELVDAEGRRITTPGQRGEIVGTGFINTVVPFIRYRTGDFATYMAERCAACGREQMVLRDIRGHRTQEVLLAADGSTVPWVALNMHDDTFDNVIRLQFRQDTPGSAVLRVVPTAAFGEADRRRILSRLEAKLQDRVRIELETCDAIPLSARGKAIYVDQRIKLPDSAREMNW